MTFSVEPNRTIKEFEHLFKKQSAILEVGCGEGQNVLYLAKQGYCDIDAFDISESPDIAPFAIGLAKDGEIKKCIMTGKFCNFNHICLKMSTQMYQSICMP